MPCGSSTVAITEVQTSSSTSSSAIAYTTTPFGLPANEDG
jgi:hypothetical protein